MSAVTSAKMAHMAVALGPAPLVGRTREIRRLLEMVGLEAGGSRCHVLVSGDAGVGKSRVIAELSQAATEAGWRVMLGHCVDFGDNSLPYLPFTEALGRLASEEGELVESFLETAPVIARLHPSHRFLAESPPREQPTERASLFEAVHGVLDELARLRPLVLVIEDLHWSDQSTRELLGFLFTREFINPVTVVASHRSDDLHRSHPLRPVLASWGRLSTVQRLALEPLGEKEMRSIARALSPAPLREKELRRMLQRAEGNPFFLEELVAASESCAEQLPGTLAELMLVRLDRLDEDARAVVRAVAVAGRRIPHELLSLGAGLEEPRLGAALRAAVEANVLVGAGGDDYAFRHALFAEAVYADLLPGERARMHAAYARALAARQVRGTAAELARHAFNSHDLVTAAGASIDAGDEAMAVGGPDDASRHYEMALELLSDEHVVEAFSAGPAPLDVVSLVERASAAALAAGRPMRAIALGEEQLRAMGDGAAAFDRARLLFAVATAALIVDSPIDVYAYTSEALALLSQEPPGPLQARVLALHARASAMHDKEEGARFAGEALSVAERFGLEDVAADLATTIGNLKRRESEPAAVEEALIRAVEVTEVAGDLTAQLRARFSLGSVYYEGGRLAEALRVFQQTSELARSAGRPWGPYALDSRAMVSCVAYVTGDWALAEEVTDVRAESPPELAEAILAARSVELGAGRGDADALPRAELLRTSWDKDGIVAIVGGAALIELRGQTGDVEGAWEAHEAAVETVVTLWQQHFFSAQIRLAALLLGAVSSAVAGMAPAERTRQAERGGELATRLLADVRSLPAQKRRELGIESIAWVARLEAERARLFWLSGHSPPDEEELFDLWLTAVEKFTAFGHVFETARSRTRLAAVLLAAGKTAQGREHLEAARRSALELGAAPLLSEIDSVAPPSLERRNGRRLPQSLTPREAEVLALVAEGRSNGEIGRQLFISTKTVSVHVSNILAKLQASSRTEAVALARRNGILAEPPGGGAANPLG